MMQPWLPTLTWKTDEYNSIDQAKEDFLKEVNINCKEGWENRWENFASYYENEDLIYKFDSGIWISTWNVQGLSILSQKGMIKTIILTKVSENAPSWIKELA